MAAICISLVLLVVTLEVCTAGWYTRFNVLNREFKAQSEALAHSCLDGAVMQLMAAATYTGDATSTYPTGTCYIALVQFRVPHAGMVTLRVRAVVSNVHTTLVAEYQMHDVQLDLTPDSAPANGSEDLTVTLQAWHELPEI